MDRSRLKHWPSSHRISAREFVSAQIVGIGAGGIAMVSGLDWLWALAIGCVVAGSMLLHVGGWSVMSWIARYFRYLRHKDVDGGTIVSFHTPSEQSIGLRGGRIFTRRCRRDRSPTRLPDQDRASFVRRVPPSAHGCARGLSSSARHLAHRHRHCQSRISRRIRDPGHRSLRTSHRTIAGHRNKKRLACTTFRRSRGFCSSRAPRRGRTGRGPRDRCCRQSCHPGSRYSRMQGADPDRTGNCLVHGQVTRGVAGNEVTETWRSTPLPGVSNVGYGIEPRFITASTLTRIWAVATVGTSVTIRLRPQWRTRRGEGQRDMSLHHAQST